MLVVYLSVIVMCVKMISELIFIFSLLLFYGFIIPKYGNEVYEICISHYRCSQYLSTHSLLSYLNKDLTIDLADNQLKEFRSILLLLLSLSLLTVILHEISRKINFSTVSFHVIFGMIFTCIQHGYQVGIVLLMIIFSYFIGKYFRTSRYGFISAWICGILVILFKESYRLKYEHGFEVEDFLCFPSFSLFYYLFKYLFYNLFFVSFFKYFLIEDLVECIHGIFLLIF